MRDGKLVTLAIESSCDETAASVVEDGRVVLSNVIASQVEEHKIYGGVVPEIASRRHTEAICGVIDKALEDANCTLEDIDALAVTYAPGLIGALLTGVNFAKGLSLSLKKPLIAVHHLRGHIAANYLTHKDLKPPFLCLVVSGGNTIICKVEDYTDFKIIGQTLDDAAGECFDKVGRVLGMPYPGGAALDKMAQQGDETKYTLPRSKPGENPYNMSFSGLKTAALNLIHHAEQVGEKLDIPSLCAAFTAAVSDTLVPRVELALKQVGMYEFRNHAPHLLSGGQKQRIAIAGIIAMEPKCIVLDEPTAMLDPRGRREVMETVLKLNREKQITVVLITHHMDEAARAQRVVVLHKGSVAADGTPRQVFSQIGLLHRLGLAAPDTTELCYALNQNGFDLPLDALETEECAQALYERLKA